MSLNQLFMSKTKTPQRHTADTYELKNEFMEHPKGKSETVPDDSYTIHELMSRFRSGLPLTQRAGEYDLSSEEDDEEAAHDNQDLEKFRNMDISEQQEIVEEAKEALLTDRERKRLARQEQLQKIEDEKVEKKALEILRKREEEANAKKALPSSTN